MIALWTAVALAAPLARAPYLQRTTPTETTVVWATALPSTGEVRWGTDPLALDHSATSGSAFQHEVRLTGLSPSTKYWYEVRSDGDVAASGLDRYVVTNPPVGSREPVRIWVVGDSGTGQARQYAVKDAMLAYAEQDRPDLYLHVGDMAYTDGTWLQFTTNFFLPYQDVLANMTVWPAMGNHEGHSADSGTQTGPYYEAYVLPKGGEAGGVTSGTEAYYSFDYANVHFVVLDSHDSDRSPDGAMLTWAAADLAATTQEWIVALWHHPPYTKGSHDSDVESQLVEMRENALPILEAGGVDLVLTGHSHIYERSYLLDGAYDTPSTTHGILDADDGIPGRDGPYGKADAAHAGALYVVAGHGGTGVSGSGGHPLMYFTEVENGSVVLDIHENRLDVVNVRWDGVVTDRVGLVKGEGLFLVSPNGGEGLLPGATVPITWDTIGTTAEVDLEWTCDFGTTWTDIGSVPNTGRYDWVVPDFETTQVLVRVSDAADASRHDQSNARLSIGGRGIQAVPFGSDWAYHDADSDPGSGWRDASYDDSSWARGPAPLGYGDGDEATVLYDDSPNVPSVYFRKVLTVPYEVDSARLSVVYDDGIAVWLDGQQVLAQNVLLTTHGAWALGTSSDNMTAEIEVPGHLFHVGDNVIAVMVKQADGSSSDVSFDLELEIDLDHEAAVCPTVAPDTGDTASDDTADDTADDTSAGDDTEVADDTATTAPTCGCRGGSSPLGLLAALALARRRSLWVG